MKKLIMDDVKARGEVIIGKTVENELRNLLNKEIKKECMGNGI